MLLYTGTAYLHAATGKEEHLRITGNIVKLIKAKDIRKFIREWAQESFLSRDIRNLILNSPKLSDTALDNLQEIELDFTNYTHNTQMYFVELEFSS